MLVLFVGGIWFRKGQFAWMLHSLGKNWRRWREVLGLVLLGRFLDGLLDVARVRVEARLRLTCGLVKAKIEHTDGGGNNHSLDRWRLCC